MHVFCGTVTALLALTLTIVETSPSEPSTPFPTDDFFDFDDFDETSSSLSDPSNASVLPTCTQDVPIYPSANFHQDVSMDPTVISPTSYEVSVKAPCIGPTRRKPPLPGSTPSASHYSDWIKTQDRADVYQMCRRIYEILGIDEFNSKDAVNRASWARRLRTRGTEELVNHLFSDNVACQQRAIRMLNYHKRTAHGAYNVGERMRLSRKLNRYWQMEESKAYRRFLRQSVRFPEVVNMIRSDDEMMVRKAAEIMTPRLYCLFEKADSTSSNSNPTTPSSR